MGWRIQLKSQIRDKKHCAAWMLCTGRSPALRSLRDARARARKGAPGAFVIFVHGFEWNSLEPAQKLIISFFWWVFNGIFNGIIIYLMVILWNPLLWKNMLWKMANWVRWFTYWKAWYSYVNVHQNEGNEMIEKGCLAREMEMWNSPVQCGAPKIAKLVYNYKLQ